LVELDDLAILDYVSALGTRVVDLDSYAVIVFGPEGESLLLGRGSGVGQVVDASGLSVDD